MDVLKGVFRQSKSFSGKDKKEQNVLRSPSLSHEITLSDDVRTSKTEKFEKLFAGGPSVASNADEENENEDEDDDDENDELNTSRIIDQRDKRHLNVNRQEAVNSWNDSELSFQDNPILIKNANSVYFEFKFK